MAQGVKMALPFGMVSRNAAPRHAHMTGRLERRPIRAAPARRRPLRRTQQPQIILLKEGTDTSQGKPQLISNINACVAVADVVRTTLGPRGMDKLIHDDRVGGRAGREAAGQAPAQECRQGGGACCLPRAGGCCAAGRWGGRSRRSQPGVTRPSQQQKPRLCTSRPKGGLGGCATSAPTGRPIVVGHLLTQPPAVPPRTPNRLRRAT